MFRQALTFGGTLLVAAAVLGTIGSRPAQARGGAHYGGAHYGGAHFGGAHYSGAHYGGARLGGYHFGGYRTGAYGGGYRYGSFHSYYRPRYGYGGYYPYYGLYGSYPSYDYAPYYDDSYSYGDSSPAYYSGSYDPLGAETPSYLDTYSPVTPPAVSPPASYPATTNSVEVTPAQTDQSAQVTVRVPANAVVWFDGKKTTTIGSVREYQSPPLNPGDRYTYVVRARWEANGQEVTQTRTIEVTAGAHVNLNFQVPHENAGQAAAVTQH